MNTLFLSVVLATAPMQGSDAVTNLVATLGKATSLSAEIKVMPIGRAASSFKIVLGKPNLARIETSDSLTVADGTTIVTLTKGDGLYVKKAQTDADLKGLLGRDELRAWAGFFDAGAFAKSGRPTPGARGPLRTATFALGGKDTLTVYVDSTDFLARKAVLEKGGVTTVVEASNLKVNDAVAPEIFAFKAPSGSREVSAEELNADKWLSNLEEAKSLASKTGRKIFVDFMASWCGPCKLLDKEVFATDRFKKLSKQFVFLKIDVDEQKSVASAYKIEAMPTQMVLDKAGNVLQTKVGYGGVDDFFSTFGG